MSRMQLVLVSLVPAFSGLALAAICGMSFLSYADQSPMMFKLVGVMGLLLGMVGVLMPPAFWLMGAPPRAAAPAKEATKGKDKGKSADQDKDDEDAEEAVSGTMDADGVEFASEGDADVFAETDTGLEVFDDDSLVSGSEEFVAEEEVEEEFEEEEEAPKKKKKR